jgi:Ca2+-binding RTX toxin-like protein
MANFNLYSWLDPKASSIGANAAIVSFKTDEIIIESTDSKMVLHGNGLISDASGLFSGTITSLQVYEMDISGAAPAEKLVMESDSPLSLDLQGLMNTMTSYYGGNSFDYLLSGNDSITGTADNDTINGRQGNDTIIGNDGDDYLYGGYY